MIPKKRFHTSITAQSSSILVNFKELVLYKDLFMSLAYRDYKIRYAQTFLGFSWALLQPIVTLIILTVIFKKALNIDTQGIPYPLFAICGMNAWTFFSYVVNQSGGSIIGAQAIIQKIYFPRIIIPLSKTLTGLVDFLINILLTFGLMLYYNLSISSNILALPLFILFTIFASVGVGIWISALTIRYRDIIHIVPFFVQIGLYLSPVAYPAELLVKRMPEWALSLYYLNPVAGIIDGFRWSILNTPLHVEYVLISFISGLVIFISGLFYFNKVNDVIADIV